MKQISFDLRSETLFELQKYEALGIRPALRDFLLSKIFPWACLGKDLTNFVIHQVEKVPKEKRLLGKISNKAHLENPDQIVVELGAEIEPFAYIAGPCYLEAGAVVRQGAYVRGSVYAAKGSVIGHTTEVKGALLLPHAKAAHFAYVGDSILGVDCNLGAGTKLANLRFDHGIVELKNGEQKISTGLKKLGAIFGNRSQAGCNSVTNPGTILLVDAMALPTQNARGILRPRAH